MSKTERFTFAAVINPYGLGPGSNPNWRNNFKKAEEACINTEGRYLDEGSECCCHCGTRCKTPTHFAFLANVAEYIDSKDDNDADDLGFRADDLGFRPVGGDCALLLKKVGVPLYTFEGVRIA